MPKFYFYKCFGVDVKSSISFPSLKSYDRNNFDVVIKYGNFDLLRNNITKRVLSDYTSVICSETGEIILIWKNIKICSIRSGKEIIINPQTGLDKNFLISLIFGYGIAILFHQRGSLVFHANAVEMFGGAVLFLGNNGVGKSTTTITLVKNGYNLIADDLLVVNDKNYIIPSVHSGLSQIKLWPEILIKMGENPELMPKVNIRADKRYYAADYNYLNELPIKTIYLLEKGPKTSINDLDSQTALMGLIKGSYCLGLFDKMELSENLSRCSKIVNNLPIKSLQIKYSLEDLPQLVNVIENDLLEQ